MHLFTHGNRSLNIAVNKVYNNYLDRQRSEWEGRTIFYATDTTKNGGLQEKTHKLWVLHKNDYLYSKNEAIGQPSLEKLVLKEL